jgi:putative peptidoglycan lipid II flippase
MAPLSGLEYGELSRSLLASLLCFFALVALRHFVFPGGSRLQELLLLLIATPLWAGLCGAVLHFTGSALPRQLFARFRRD